MDSWPKQAAKPARHSLTMPIAFHQTEIDLPSYPRGVHLITQHLAAWEEISHCRAGLLHLFLQHTSAALSINENADPDVRHDLNEALNRLAPESARYVHTCEGPDDMPAHVKCTLSGVDLTIPVHEGRLALGTWQGICLIEARNRGGRRKVILTLHGEFAS